MAGAQRFEELQAWQVARRLVSRVYALCRDSPIGKDFGLRNQICRAAVSVMSNIAEGFARKGDLEFARYLDISRGSAAEVQSLLYASLDAGLIKESDFEAAYRLADEANRVIAGLSSYIRGSLPEKGSKK